MTTDLGLGLPRFGGHWERFRVRCFPMPRTRPPYPTEFRRQMVELVRAGRDPNDLAREFEPSAQAIRNWVAAAHRREGRREAKPPPADLGLTAAKRDELVRLRRENRQLKLERDILALGRGAGAHRDAEQDAGGVAQPRRHAHRQPCADGRDRGHHRAGEPGRGQTQPSEQGTIVSRWSRI